MRINKRYILVIVLWSIFFTSSQATPTFPQIRLMQQYQTFYQYTSTSVLQRTRRSTSMEQTPAEDRIFANKYKFPFWGLPYGMYSQGGIFHNGKFPNVGGPGFAFTPPATTAPPPTTTTVAPPHPSMQGYEDYYYVKRKPKKKKKKKKKPTTEAPYECNCDEEDVHEDCDCPSYYEEKPNYKPKYKKPKKRTTTERSYNYRKKSPKTTTQKPEEEDWPEEIADWGEEEEEEGEMPPQYIPYYVPQYFNPPPTTTTPPPPTTTQYITSTSPVSIYLYTTDKSTVPPPTPCPYNHYQYPTETYTTTPPSPKYRYAKPVTSSPCTKRCPVPSPEYQYTPTTPQSQLYNSVSYSRPAPSPPQYEQGTSIQQYFPIPSQPNFEPTILQYVPYYSNDEPSSHPPSETKPSDEMFQTSESSHMMQMLSPSLNYQRRGNPQREKYQTLPQQIPTRYVLEPFNSNLDTYMRPVSYDDHLNLLNNYTEARLQIQGSNKAVNEKDPNLQNHRRDR